MPKRERGVTMGKSVIWDLDGTLFDSYDVIVESIYRVFQEKNIIFSADEIRKYALQFSVKSLFYQISESYGVSEEDLHKRYGEISRGEYMKIKLMPNAMEILEQLRLRGVKHYVFTHRGRTTIPVLENLGMQDYFIEILTSQSGFARKPDPEALHYLIRKYEMDPSQTFYAGDRSLDMECAANAGIKGILYVPENCVVTSCAAADFVVADLLDILNIV